MPFIISRVNIPVSEEQEKKLKTRLGRAIELVPGKSEEYLLLGFKDNCRLWLRGNSNAPIAYIEASIFGNESHAGYDKFTLAVTQIFNEILHIPPENIYIKYDDIKAWGVQGMYIDRSFYR
ncbi:MAG TPA: hypothetical protein DCR23_06175 [Ruminococcaceae bacterium]|nr:hypothetical protein [Oscillospiraceae bacterium]